MAHSCQIIPKVYIDKIILGNPTLSTHSNGQVTVDTGYVTVNLGFDELEEASLINNILTFSDTNIPIEDYVKVVCVLSTSADMTALI